VASRRPKLRQRDLGLNRVNPTFARFRTQPKKLIKIS
jgi:hypothetical protein